MEFNSLQEWLCFILFLVFIFLSLVVTLLAFVNWYYGDETFMYEFIRILKIWKDLLTPGK